MSSLPEKKRPSTDCVLLKMINILLGHSIFMKFSIFYHTKKKKQYYTSNLTTGLDT